MTETQDSPKTNFSRPEKSSLYLSIVIPAYNEASRLSCTLQTVRDYLKERFERFEIIVVNDGSADETQAIASDYAQNAPDIRVLGYNVNRGKGYAVRTGMLAAEGDAVLFSDADLATPIEETERLLKHLSDGYDIVIASRAVPGAELVVHQPFYREMGGRVFNRIVQFFLVPGIWDTQCGFKLFRKDVVLPVFGICEDESFAFDLEVLYVARKLGFSIAEVPVRWRHVEGSKVRVVREAFRALATMYRVRKRHRKLAKQGQY